jgi:hypothetical protein
MRTMLLAGLAILLSAGVSRAQSSPDGALLEGTKLTVTPRAVAATSEDADVDLGRGVGSADDPVVAGGRLRIVSHDGRYFDVAIDLPAARWRYLGKRTAPTGYKLKRTKPVRALVVKAGKLVKIAVKAKDLGIDLSASPEPVHVVLTLGARQYCMTFGGTIEFTEGKKYVAADAPAPATCPLDYGDESTWLCRPGLAVDQCLANSQDATAIEPDLGQAFVPHTAATDPPLDCFYVYPTVNLTGTPGNDTDFSDVSLELDPLLSQAARFTRVCRVFAPLYRQITLGTFSSPDAARHIDVAYGDVRDAFQQYLATDNAGRRFVLMGHSQGTMMVTRLMQDLVDPDPAMRERLVVALLIGGGVAVPPGELVGGTFADVPLCTSDTETGCVIAYRTYAESHPPTGGSNTPEDPALSMACTNPAALGGGPAAFAGSYFPKVLNQPIFQVAPPPDVPTAFALLRDLYAGECVADETGSSYLEIRVAPGPGDLRTNTIPFDHPVLDPGFLGTHILDYNFALEDLLRQVEVRAAALP